MIDPADDAGRTGGVYGCDTMAPGDLISRVRALHRQRLDVLIGVGLGVALQIEALLVPEYRLAAHLLFRLLAVCVALRRRYPLTTLAGTMVPFVAVQGLGREVTDHVFVGLFLCIFMAYSVAANSDSRWWWVAAPIAFGSGLLAIGIDDYEGTVAGDFLWLGLVFVAAPMVTGRLVRNRSQLQLALREKAASVEREREQAAEQAVVDERTRIAGDLHDIVAHALSEMTVQASAAGRLATRKPE